MNKVRLGDVCEAIIDCPHTTPKWRSDGIPIIRNFNLEDTVISLRDPSFVDEETYESRTRRAMPEEGDIVISREAPMGRVGLVPKDLKCCLGQRLVLLKPKHDAITSRYLLIALTSNFVQTQIRRADAAGSIVSNLTLPQIRDLIIPISDDADAIASLLGAIDDKIALNKKLCAELEETAQLIYDYWFTQFDFPDENGNPYRSSGGKMVSDETLKREIPEKWEVERLSTVSCYVNETIANTSPNMRFFISTDNMLPNRNGVVPSQYVPSEGTSTHYLPGDILLSNIRPYFKKIWLANKEGGCCNDVLAIRALSSKWRYYLYQSIWSDTFFAYDAAGAKGSKMPRGDRHHIMNYPVAIPANGCSAILANFNRQIEPIDSSISKAREENGHLITLRNWLLPMLMNGQVKLGNAPEDVTEVHV